MFILLFGMFLFAATVILEYTKYKLGTFTDNEMQEILEKEKIMPEDEIAAIRKVSSYLYVEAGCDDMLRKAIEEWELNGGA